MTANLFGIRADGTRLGKIKVRKAHLFYRYKWEVSQEGGQGFYVQTWREAIDLAMRWACTGEHP